MMNRYPVDAVTDAGGYALIGCCNCGQPVPESKAYKEELSRKLNEKGILIETLREFKNVASDWSEERKTISKTLTGNPMLGKDVEVEMDIDTPECAFCKKESKYRLRLVLKGNA